MFTVTPTKYLTSLRIIPDYFGILCLRYQKDTYLFYVIYFSNTLDTLDSSNILLIDY